MSNNLGHILCIPQKTTFIVISDKILKKEVDCGNIITHFSCIK